MDLRSAGPGAHFATGLEMSRGRQTTASLWEMVGGHGCLDVYTLSTLTVKQSSPVLVNSSQFLASFRSTLSRLSPKSGKEGFGANPRKGNFSLKSPVSPQGNTGKKEIFWLEPPFSGLVGNGGLSIPKPSFPDFGDLDPLCRAGAFARS